MQSIITNLLISHIEVRTPADIDVHTKELELVKLSMTDEMKVVRALFLEVLKIPIEKLNDLNVFWQRDPEKVGSKHGQSKLSSRLNFCYFVLLKASKCLLISAMQKFRACPSIAVPPNNHVHVQAQFALAISLYHAWAILNSYDYHSVLNMLNCLKRDVVQNNVWKYFYVHYNTRLIGSLSTLNSGE